MANVSNTRFDYHDVTFRQKNYNYDNLESSFINHECYGIILTTDRYTSSHVSHAPKIAVVY